MQNVKKAFNATPQAPPLQRNTLTHKRKQLQSAVGEQLYFGAQTGGSLVLALGKAALKATPHVLKFAFWTLPVSFAKEVVHPIGVRMFSPRTPPHVKKFTWAAVAAGSIGLLGVTDFAKTSYDAAAVPDFSDVIGDAGRANRNIATGFGTVLRDIFGTSTMPGGRVRPSYRTAGPRPAIVIPGSFATFDRLPTDEAFRGMIAIESGGNNNLVSPAGATGIAQLMPQYAPAMARKYGFDPARWRDADVNLGIGRALYHDLKGIYGSNTLASMAYNCGSGCVDSHIKKYGDPRTGDISIENFVSTFNKETRAYVPAAAGKLGIQIYKRD